MEPAVARTREADGRRGVGPGPDDRGLGPANRRPSRREANGGSTAAPTTAPAVVQAAPTASSSRAGSPGHAGLERPPGEPAPDHAVQLPACAARRAGQAHARQDVRAEPGRVDTAPDFKSATFKLRPNIKFHDGSPRDADDVKFTYMNYRGANAKILTTSWTASTRRTTARSSSTSRSRSSTSS